MQIWVGKYSDGERGKERIMLLGYALNPTIPRGSALGFPSGGKV